MKIAYVIIALFVLLGISGTVYVVKEPEQVIVTQFGKPVGDQVLTPGLKIKIPFIQKVHRFEKRFLEWDGLLCFTLCSGNDLVILRLRLVDQTLPLLFCFVNLVERGFDRIGWIDVLQHHLIDFDTGLILIT